MSEIDAILYQYNQLLGMLYFVEATSGLTPEEHAAFWDKVWKVNHLKNEHPDLFKAIQDEIWRSGTTKCGCTPQAVKDVITALLVPSAIGGGQ